MNRRKIVTFILSLMIHGAVLTLLWLFLHDKNIDRNASSARRVELSLSDFITPPPSVPATKPSPKAKAVENKKPSMPRPALPHPAAKPKSRPETPKPVSRKRAETTSQRVVEKRTKRTVQRKKRPVERKASKPSPTISKTAQKHTNPPKPLQPKKSNPLSQLAGALGAPAVPESSRPSPPTIDQINRTFSKKAFHALYKDEFDRFTPEQKKFIENNLARIQGITQHYLTQRGYPPFAGEMGQQGTNVVEFYLLPNGDITDLKIITPTGFEQLDQNSLDTIKTAYKDYPRPKEKTKIRFYIHYSIY
jgi:protein TonB